MPRVRTPKIVEDFIDSIEQDLFEQPETRVYKRRGEEWVEVKLPLFTNLPVGKFYRSSYGSRLGGSEEVDVTKNSILIRREL